jgi:hypothetical protein
MQIFTHIIICLANFLPPLSFSLGLKSAAVKHQLDSLLVHPIGIMIVARENARKRHLNAREGCSKPNLATTSNFLCVEYYGNSSRVSVEENLQE